MSLGIWTTSVEETFYPELHVPIVGSKIPLTMFPARTETIAMSSVVNPVMFLPGVINLWFLGWFLAGLAAMVSSFDRFRWRTLGILAAFYFVNAGLKVVGMGSESLQWVKKLSVFSFYSPASVIERTSVNPWSVLHVFRYNAEGQLVGIGLFGSCLALFALGLAAYWVGLKRFESRDLPAPM
jgi:ABC-2 type transport system permease protein